MSKRIEKLLEEALLSEGKMEYGLYEFELEEHIDYWTDGMIKDRDLFVFVVTENRGSIAMVLITNKKDIYINEEARSMLQHFWPKEAYIFNLKKLIPEMAKQLSKGILAVNGVKYN